MNKLLEAIKKMIEDGGEIDEDAIKAAYEESVKGLSDKNDELLDEVKKLKRKARNADPNEMFELRSQVEDLQDELKKTRAELEKIQGKYEKDTKQLTEQLEAERGAVQSLVVDRGLTEALAEAGVKNQAYLKAAKALLQGQVEVKSDGDDRVAVVGDKPLGDYVKEWSQSDEGKAFVSAPVNSGGGAGGTITNSSGQNKSWSEMSLKERSELARDNPELYQQMKEGA